MHSVTPSFSRSLPRALSGAIASALACGAMSMLPAPAAAQSATHGSIPGSSTEQQFPRLPAPQPAAAETPVFDIPTGCKYGRDTYDPSAEAVSDAIEAGYDYARQDPDASEEEQDAQLIVLLEALVNIVDSYEYLRIEAPKHVLRYEPFRVKANLFDMLAYVKFNNSEDGYVGRDKSNFEANSYLTMVLEDTYGYGLLWVARGPLCSASGVWVQEAPGISYESLEIQGTTIEAAVHYSMDDYSRAVLAPSVEGTVTFELYAPSGALVSTQEVPVTGKDGVVSGSLRPRATGLHTVRAAIHDGTFTERVVLGHLLIDGTIAPEPGLPPAIPGQWDGIGNTLP